MKLAALFLFLSLAGSVAASDAAKHDGSSSSAPDDSSKAAKATEENGNASAKTETRNRPPAAPRRIPYHMLMIR